MIERYTRAAMQKVWSLEQQYQSWLEVEIAVMDGLVQEGGRVSELRSIRPTVTELALVEQNAKFNVEEIADLEKVTKHDMVAFTRNISASLGPEKSGFIMD